MTNPQTEARAIARKLQDVIEGHSWRLNIDKATDIIATALAAKDAKIQALDDECQQSMLDISRERDRAERAEAQLAEANRKIAEKDRTLEPFANVAEHDIGEDEDDSDTFWPISNARYSMSGRLRVGHLRAARRALTGGQEDG